MKICDLRVGHLLHGERTDWIPRARHILAGETRPFESFDRLAQFAESQDKSLGQLLEIFADLRRENVAALDTLTDRWTKSLNIRQFLIHCEKTLSKEGPISAESLEARWLSWARTYADELDPLNGDQLHQSLHTKFTLEDECSQ